MFRGKQVFKDIGIIGLGAILFMGIGYLVKAPVGVLNTYFEITYPLLALVSGIFGPIVAFFIGFLGHALKDFLQGGIWWSWVLCSGVSGYVYGCLLQRIQFQTKGFRFRGIVTFNVFQFLAHLGLWGFLAPTLDVILYREALGKVYLQGVSVAVVNSLAVGIIGTLLLRAYHVALEE